ncbi:hypothetical protein J6590_013951 [Homalodisca vitripennis]|nr:hypothetical protein J6590_013951 [Homalodisca vitripennis]
MIKRAHCVADSTCCVVLGANRVGLEGHEQDVIEAGGAAALCRGKSQLGSLPLNSITISIASDGPLAAPAPTLRMRREPYLGLIECVLAVAARANIKEAAGFMTKTEAPKGHGRSPRPHTHTHGRRNGRTTLSVIH